MTKDKFLQDLNKALDKLPKAERDDILQDYEDHFAFGFEEGKTEEEISNSLGMPSQIAKDLLANYHIERATTSATTGNIFRAMWAIIGLSFFNLVIVLGPAIALAAIIFSGWLVGIAFIASPLMVIVDAILNPGGFMLFNVFISLALCGAGFFIVFAMFYITKFVNKGFISYLKFNMNLVKGGLKNDE